MPQAYPSHYPGKIHRLRDAAALGQMLVVRCGLCRRMARYLASDLAEILDPSRDALAPPFPCSHCNRSDYIRLALRIPAPGDYGHLSGRRPAGVRTTRLCRTVRLGD